MLITFEISERENVVVVRDQFAFTEMCRLLAHAHMYMCVVDACTRRGDVVRACVCM